MAKPTGRRHDSGARAAQAQNRLADLLRASRHPALRDRAALAQALAALETGQARRVSRDQLATYRPYSKQAAFHAWRCPRRCRLANQPVRHFG